MFRGQEEPHPVDRRCARRGWELAKESVLSRKYRVVILDEVNVAVDYGLVPLEELLDLMSISPGRGVDSDGPLGQPQVIRRADLVTEMRDVRHYYRKGIESRIGIER